MASAQSHTAWIIFQQMPFYFTGFLLYYANSLKKQEMFLPTLYIKQFK